MKVVIVGGGFGGLECAKALGGLDGEVVVIDRRNHHLFQPLLYQVATAGLSPADISAPIRSVLSSQSNTRVVLGEVTGVDLAARKVRVEGLADVPFDHLVLATGARHSYFGHDDWQAFAPGLKSVPEAIAIRRRILLAFERAETEADPAERERLLSFVIVGGGPTGVELAGSIAELAHRVLASDFRTINPQSTRITLVEAGPRVLRTFPESLSGAAARALGRLGVEVRATERVERIDADGVVVGGRRVRAATVIWAAGVQASPAARWLGAEADSGGRVKVGADLTVPSRPDVSVIGDTANVGGPSGEPLPGVCPVAMQQGRYVARRLLAVAHGRPAPPPFRYVDKGNLATIGRSCAVAQIGSLRIAGLAAWVAWVLVHILYLIGFRNRLAVMLDWAWSYVTYQRGARLITENGDHG